MTDSPTLPRVKELLRQVRRLINEIEISDPLTPLENSRKTYPAVCELSRELKVHPAISASKMLNGTVLDTNDPIKGHKRSYDLQWANLPPEVWSGIAEPFKAEILEHLNAWACYLEWWVELDGEKPAAPMAVSQDDFQIPPLQ